MPSSCARVEELGIESRANLRESANVDNCSCDAIFCVQIGEMSNLETGFEKSR